MIEISEEEFLFLRAAELKLNLLEIGGVDNWHGYEESLNFEGKTFAELCKELSEKIIRPEEK